jgi:hypothetical protein
MGRAGIWNRMQNIYHCRSGNLVWDCNQLGCRADLLDFKGIGGDVMNRQEDMPLGLGFGLAMNEQAMNSFSSMTEQEKRQVIEAARSTQSKVEMENLIRDIANMQ